MKFHFHVLLGLLVSQHLFAQDTLRISIQQADSILLARNLTLIASRYNVDMAEAQKVQARLFRNPELSTEWNLYNPTKQKYFDTGPQGQKIIALQQVFNIAGQRNIAIRMAEQQKKLSEFEYYEVARSLKYELHVTFFRYHYMSRAINHIRSQLALLQRLIEVYKGQYDRGNISLQELTRLNTTFFSINNQVKETQMELYSLQQDLKILLAEKRTIEPQTSTEQNVFPILTLDALQQRALTNRPDFKIAEGVQQQSLLEYAMQKREAIPSLSAGVLYDQAGSYVQNYSALTLGLQVPIFNRNQGRIKAAKFLTLQSAVNVQQKRGEIDEEVEASLNRFNFMVKQDSLLERDFEQKLDQLSEGLVTNYSKNNISLLEFTDLFESYNTNIIQFNEHKANLQKSYEDLVYVVGEDLSK